MVQRLFLICLGVLAAASAALYWTLPDQRSPVPVLYWITQVDSTKLETIARFKTWLHDRGLPPVEVRIDNVNQDPTKKLAQGLAGVGADIFDIYTFETELFAQSGMLMDVTDAAHAGGYSPAATYPAFYDDLVVNGRQYGFPRNAGGNMIWANATTFARYGVPLPSAHWTWDEFEQLGKKLVTAANPPGTRQRVYFIQDLELLNPTFLRRGLGLEVFNETMTHCTLNDPRNAEVMRRLYRWVVELRLIPTLAEQKTMAADAGRAGDEWFYLYAKGRYAMLFCDRWALIRLRDLGTPPSRIVEPFNSGFRNMEFGCGIISALRGHQTSRWRPGSFSSSLPASPSTSWSSRPGMRCHRCPSMSTPRHFSIRPTIRRNGRWRKCSRRRRPKSASPTPAAPSCKRGRFTARSLASTSRFITR